MIGQNVPRFDGVAKVIGTARYIDDVPPLEGELFGHTVRSPVARGLLKKITLDPSFDWSDVTVVTAADCEHNVVALIEDDQPIL
ncbi:MAG: xanthine dehydrogenase family protein molybdopterin-binding subunit, partial [Polyangiales bacterium]